MSYRAGIGARLAHRFGAEPSDPHIVCDGCGMIRTVYKRAGHWIPAAWLLDGRPAPGWAGGRNADGLTRTDYCPVCKATRAKEGAI